MTIPPLTPDSWPAAFSLPLVHDFAEDIGSHVRPLQLVTNDTSYFLVGEGDGMLRE